MRIAIFTDTYLPDKNGVSFSIDRFTRLMADDGHQIIIFCPKSGRHKDKKYPNLTVRRFSSVSVPSYKDMKIALPSIMTVVKELKDFQPDIVHVQTPMGIGWIGIWATKILKLKNVQTYHTYIPDYLSYLRPKSLFGIKKIANNVESSRLVRELVSADVSEESYESSKFQSYLAQKIKTIVDGVNKDKDGKFNKRFGRDFTRAVYNRADMVLTPSNAMLKILKKQGVKVESRVLSNGIDYDFFKKKTDYSIKNKMLYIGRLGFEKNIDVVLKAFAIALNTNKELTLDIFGDGPARPSLQNLSKSLGISKNVKFFGVYDINKMSGRLRDYDFFATASTSETQGLVVLEAMASGLPVLGVDKLAIPEVVVDDKNGYLSRPFDSEEMAKNMLKLLESSKRLEKFGKGSLEIAKSHEIKKCKDKLIGIYEEVSGGDSATFETY